MKSTPFEGRSSEMRAPSPWLASEDLLDCGDVTVTIEKVMLHPDATFDDGRKQKVYSLRFEGKDKEMVLNATNRKTLVARFGTKVKDWAGKEITLYVDTRVRKPGGKANEYTCGIRIR